MRVDAEDPNGSRTVLPAFMHPSSLPGLVIPKRAFWSASQRCMKTPDSLFYLGFHCYSLSFVTCRFRLSVYSHSFTLVCRGDNPVDSSLVVGFSRLAAESCRVISRSRLGQILGQIRELYRNREPAVSFLSRGQKRAGFGARKRPRCMIKRLIFLFGACLAK